MPLDDYSSVEFNIGAYTPAELLENALVLVRAYNIVCKAANNIKGGDSIHNLAMIAHAIGHLAEFLSRLTLSVEDTPKDVELVLSRLQAEIKTAMRRGGCMHFINDDRN